MFLDLIGLTFIFCIIQAAWQKDGMIRPLPALLHAAALSFGGYRLRIVHRVNEREPPLRFVYSSTGPEFQDT